MESNWSRRLRQIRMSLSLFVMVRLWVFPILIGKNALLFLNSSAWTYFLIIICQNICWRSFNNIVDHKNNEWLQMNGSRLVGRSSPCWDEYLGYVFWVTYFLYEKHIFFSLNVPLIPHLYKMLFYLSFSIPLKRCFCLHSSCLLFLFTRIYSRNPNCFWE